MFMPRPACAILLLLNSAIAVLLAGGCGTVTDTLSLDRTAPSSTQRALAGPPTPIAVAVFVEPGRVPVPLNNIGAGMSDELARTLLRRNRFDVWMNQDLSRQLDRRSPNLQRVAEQFPQLRYLVTGRVTDFVQTTDLPESLRPKSWLGRPKNQAVVSMVVRVTDLQTARVIGTDRFTGRETVPDDVKTEMYKHVAFGSHLFWSTPLGRATRDAIEQATDRIERLVPARLEEPRIASRMSRRRVRIDGGRLHGLKAGQEYYIYPTGRDDTPGEPVLDNVTDRPVVVRIDTVDDRRATGWLLGRPEPTVELPGMRLRPETDWSPPDATTAASATGAGANSPADR